jgi:hypothetical protein
MYQLAIATYIQATSSTMVAIRTICLRSESLFFTNTSAQKLTFFNSFLFPGVFNCKFQSGHRLFWHICRNSISPFMHILIQSFKVSHDLFLQILPILSMPNHSTLYSTICWMIFKNTSIPISIVPLENS